VLKTLMSTAPGASAMSSPRWTIVANKAELNIRVVNLSIAAGVYESYASIRSRLRQARG
jgi:hypothetical protein